MGLLKSLMRRRRPIARELQPLNVEATPYALPPTRHADPGAQFVSGPKPRTDLGVLSIQAGALVVNAPPLTRGRVRWQLKNGDWMPWRTAAGAVSSPVDAIAVEYQVLGSG